MTTTGQAARPKRGATAPVRPHATLAILAAVFSAFALAAPPAHAALYGYVDDEGVAHFADRRLDDRYTLFMRDGASAELGGSGQTGADLRSHKLYRYLVDHPRIASVEPMIRQIAQAQSVDPALVKAVMAVESGFNANAVSPKGAIGLMQVIPDTGARFGVSADTRRTIEQKLADPRTNIAAGVRYLRWLMELFPDNLELVLAAYNAGEGAVQRYNNQIPPFPETRQYVSTVMQFYRLYQPGGAPPRLVRTSRATGQPVGRIKMVIGGRSNMP
jgi:soluble lytic murein transglycosylase-like protein